MDSMIYDVMDELSVLAIIPARSGSKGLPGKNIINCAGRPLISWSIVAAVESKYITRVVVTTDSEEIAEVAKEYGAWVPFLRKPDLAKDDSSITDVVNDVINNIKNQFHHDLVILLQPTSPLRNSIHVDESIEIVINKEMNGITGVTEVSHPYEWTNTLSDNLSMNEFISKEAYFTRSQDFPKRYQINGAIYMLNKYSLMLDKKMIPDKNSMAYIMDKKSSVDIDTEDDFLLASFYLQINS